MSGTRIITVTPENIAEMGVLCGAQAQFSRGAAQKMDWYRRRYAQGLRIKLSLDETGTRTGMIEYVPGEYAFRTVRAKGYMVIHCLEVLRSHTRHGYGGLLLQECVQDSQGMDGIAVLTSSKPWINDKRFFLKSGFRQIDKAPPYFELLVRQFREAALPALNSGWEERAAAYGPGITVIYSDQCPIIDWAIGNIRAAARECGLEARLEKMETCAQAQNAPFPSGTFGILKDGKFLTHRIYDKEAYVQLLRNS